MVGKNQVKRITGLHQKKYRQQEQRFIAEGAKVIAELLHAGFLPESVFATEALFGEFPKLHVEHVSEAELKKLSALSTVNNCLAVFVIPKEKPVDLSGLIVALDEVRDPGNLGTIIRLCDWFGISQLVCSKGCADVYNPKVVQATMGSLARVNVSYVDLKEFLTDVKTDVFGTFTDGSDIYTSDLPSSGMIVLGNEANGISPDVEVLCNRRLSIPRFGDIQRTESLNVAMATGIILSEFRRRTL